jgi:hypothetical protein
LSLAGVLDGRDLEEKMGSSTLRTSMKSGEEAKVINEWNVVVVWSQNA